MAKTPQTDALDEASAAIKEMVVAEIINNEEVVAQLVNDFEMFQYDENGELVPDENNNAIMDEDAVNNFVERAADEIMAVMPAVLGALVEAEGGQHAVDIWLNQNPDTPEAGEGEPAAVEEEQQVEEDQQAAPTKTIRRTTSGLAKRTTPAPVKKTVAAPAKAAPTAKQPAKSGGLRKRQIKTAR